MNDEYMTVVYELRDSAAALSSYARCQVDAFSSGHAYLDMTLFHRLCERFEKAKDHFDIATAKVQQ